MSRLVRLDDGSVHFGAPIEAPKVGEIWMHKINLELFEITRCPFVYCGVVNINIVQVRYGDHQRIGRESAEALACFLGVFKKETEKTCPTCGKELK